MPIERREGEDRDDFISRCMSEEKDAIPDQDQRLAACNDMWERSATDTSEAQASNVVEFLGLPKNSASAGYQFKAAKNDAEAELIIYGEIGDELFGGVSAQQIAEDLRASPNLKRIVVRMNSPGGSVFDGIAIYNLLTQNKARVEVYVDGIVASAASVIAMAGRPIHMAENATMMIHDPWHMAIGNARELRALADSLDKVADAMALTYSRRSGNELNVVRAWMEQETWFSAEEAKAAGFADTLEESRRMAASFDPLAWRKRFRHPPEGVFAQLEEMMKPAGTPVSSFDDEFRRMAMLTSAAMSTR